MNERLIAVAEREAELTERVILASESWGKSFEKDPVTHAKIIKVEVKMSRINKKLFHDYADNIEKYLMFRTYVTADVTVQVDVSDDLYNDMNNEFLTVNFEVLSTAIAAGAQAGETIYKKPLAISSLDAAIQKLTSDRLSYLIGKRVDKDGNVVDNPKADYRITDKTRDDINQAIKSSIQIGEDKNALIDRLKKVVDSPKRAALIAQTESVNAFSSGMLHFAEASGATGKEWEDIGAVDVCHTYAELGPKPLDYAYDGVALRGPAAHPGCRCSQRVLYENEYNPNK